MRKSFFWIFFAIWNVFLLIFMLTKSEEKHVLKQEPKTLEQIDLPLERIKIENEKNTYAVTNAGALMDFACLKEYKAKIGGNEGVNLIENFQKADGSRVFLKYSGNTDLPNEKTKWKIEKNNNKIKFFWKNKENVLFIQEWTLDENHGIKIVSKVENGSKKTFNIKASIVIERKKQFEEAQNFVFRGISAFLDGKLQDIAPEGLQDQIMPGKSGWAGFNERYWLVAFAGKNFSRIEVQKKLNYLIEGQSEEKTITAGDKIENDFNLYIGPKDNEYLKKFESYYEIDGMEKSIDYGWFFFLTKPMHAAMDWMIKQFGSVALALISLILLIKIISLPFTTRGHKAMLKMQRLSPQINDIKERLKENPQQMNMEIFALYKKEKINPISGCLPVLIQIPLFFPLYKVLSVSIKLRHAPFLFWIKDLSAADTTHWSNFFGILPWEAIPIFSIGAWPLIMGITMLIQQKFSATSEMQSPLMLYALPIIFTWMMSSLPSGLVIYWSLTNILSIAHMIWLNKTLKN